MPKAISRKKLVQKLRKLGFDGPYPGGRHLFMVKGELKLHVPNPHSTKDVSRHLLSEILRQAGISAREMRRMKIIFCRLVTGRRFHSLQPWLL